MKQPGTWGECDFCRSETYLYPRLKKLSCRGCIEMGVAPGRLRTSRTATREDDLKLNPLSQPSPVTSHRGGNCVYCSIDCNVAYAWQNTVAYACGWGHAGFWMDGEIAVLEATDMLTGGTDA